MASRKAVALMAAGLLAALCLAAGPAAIERYYNRTATLRLDFEQTHIMSGRTRVETGSLALRKPGRMRWDYADGKVFVSDGRAIWFHQPAENRAEFSRAKDSEDLRAPLAFLLGRLDFGKLFQEVRVEGGTVIAVPKSAQSPYREIRLEALASGRIERVEIVNQDASRMLFVFRNEQRNVPVAESLFRFVPPPGTQIVEDREP